MILVIGAAFARRRPIALIDLVDVRSIGSSAKAVVKVSQNRAVSPTHPYTASLGAR